MKTQVPLVGSLTSRFIRLMLAITLLGIALVAALSHYQHAMDAREDASRIAIDRALTIQDAIESAATGESLSRFILSTAAQPSIRAIALLNAEQTVVFASRHRWQGDNVETLAEVIDEEWLARPAGDHASAHWDGANDQVVVIAPIDPINPASSTVAGLREGRLLLAFHASDQIAGARVEAWSDAAWAGGILLLVMALLARALHQRVGRPVAFLYQRASHPGDLSSGPDPIMAGAPQELQVLGNAVDELAATRMALDRERKRVFDIANTIPGAVYEYRHHPDREDEFTFVSAGFSRLLGLDDETDSTSPPSSTFQLFWSRIVPEDRIVVEQSTAAANATVAREWAVEFRIETQSGIRWVWGHAVPVNDSHPGQLFRGVLLDVTPRKELEQQLQQAATHDWLTGALNRAGIEPQLETGLAGAQRAQKPLAVLMLDIDHFKTVNDTFGHTVGDEVLKQLVTTIQNRLRKSDSLARWGGEEFLILLPDTDRQGACQLAETLRRGVADQPFTHGQKVTISLGATEARTDETVNSLVQRADDCLYQAKTLGRNRVIAAMEEDQTVKPS